VLLRDLPEQALRLRPALVGEGRLGESELQLAQEIARRQVALPAMLLTALRIEDDEDRRPLDREALEGLRLLLDVDLGRDEVLRDEGADARIGVDLGVQPSARPSERRRVEVDEHVAPGRARLGECGVHVVLPLYGHGVPPRRAPRALAPRRARAIIGSHACRYGIAL
jgi:hypothetical protein